MGLRLSDLLLAESCSDNWYALPIRILIRMYRFIRITIREFLDDHLLLRAMAMTFATLLSLIPLLIISFSMFKLFGGGEWFMEMLRPLLERNLTPGIGSDVVLRIETLLQSSGSKKTGGIGLLFLVLTVYGIFTAVAGVFNGIWGVSSKGSILQRLPLYWGLVTIIPILVLSSLALTGYVKALPLVNKAVESVSYANSFISWFLPVFMVVLSFFLLYRFIPDTRVRTHAALFGAVVAGALYELVKFAFISYTGKVVTYNIIYGSLAIIPLLIIWINLSWVVVLIGVEVSYVTQHYKLLYNKRKHVIFSRHQKDALAYQILVQAVLAFRGKRNSVTFDEWSIRYEIPLGIVSEVVDVLSAGGLLHRMGKARDELLLTQDPTYITIDQIEKILSRENDAEWIWPPESDWSNLKGWMQYRRKFGSGKVDPDMTLDKLVSDMEVEKKVVNLNIVQS